MNYSRYPWLEDLSSSSAREAIATAKQSYIKTGAATFPEFISPSTLSSVINDVTHLENDAYTTDDRHTPHQLPIDTTSFPTSSVRNFKMRTQVASVAYDELGAQSELTKLYQHPTLRQLVAEVTGKQELFLLDCPIGSCTVNVFREGYHHSFHFDESEFSTTLMIQEAEQEGTGLFQYTNALRENVLDDLALDKVAAVIREYHAGDDGQTHNVEWTFCETDEGVVVPELHTLEFRPGTLSIFSGARSLHRVTKVEGKKSRLVAVLTFASFPGFQNSKEVQKMFWGRCI
mmetsp:Transcript_12293/g.15324  ORF Transcript_12293/g.15324 Transcript_12293/m.15324 type:complete len:288 (+) Transcript_12293:85-948(+)|eukprot:CAMPEP_0172493366 /NCGR_PEP_ID=MMETSP1066-20121228/24799_1 /TAXON_ID=671091 /ORGANISM="Coscinodiscus wailesii, Strain CCMP2513" /LENGTH=287 /DNA_ID=CAMNT_0013263511 /DNA_START=65 /DNA_END=928 /DNA_ORIENTATION=+